MILKSLINFKKTPLGAWIIFVCLRSLIALLLLANHSCRKEKGDKNEDAPTIGVPPERISEVSLQPIQIPDGKNGYMKISSSDFINGYYDQDIIASKPSPGISSSGEEAVAKKSGIFLSAPGFMWKIDPSSPVTVTLSARGKSQTIKRDFDQDSIFLPISLLSFPDVFPPVFRERYEMTIASYPGVTTPFSYTYTFNVRRSDADVVYAKVFPGDAPSSMKMGMDTANYTIAKIEPSEKCSQCTIEVERVSLSAKIKYFVELPAVPSPGDLRISFPRRFSGLLVKRRSLELNPSIIGNNTSNVAISTAIPGSLTTVPAWCLKKTNPPGSCPVVKNGLNVPSYFRFMNAVPLDSQTQSLGGVNGIASLYITGEAKIKIRRDGFILEEKTVTLDSGETSPLNSPFLPNWALDDIRNALFSGAPEFSF